MNPYTVLVCYCNGGIPRPVAAFRDSFSFSLARLAYQSLRQGQEGTRGLSSVDPCRQPHHPLSRTSLISYVNYVFLVLILILMLQQSTVLKYSIQALTLDYLNPPSIPSTLAIL